ncbi:hypothetical protein A1Q1_02343 [Trichosporon asahii var. asahii CBS 2479]|uniref:SGNH hydrolase-type esterase domain-containing protein n=1 Tax=Trichosporon asahii var. asahii (strain ATCC 90039 / CBS 2479 / JCM 2466 / KCTC 7840 / NBRC 103889/ NCYC 2677 / UAMH 7654) TaxID=1186058 RepID=J5T179_TRIAS|nr:hypothetical protein A1Q1_02343 [Trichosporon asahii var. asahii CBS 2479]EJT48616.1 hypothetical protein A1Q1_02343 [Trichosporon asahii var. asahii CBS 2479]
MRRLSPLPALVAALLFFPLRSFASFPWLAPLSAVAAPLPGPKIPGKYVRFSNLDQCPDLAPHEPKNSRDVRLDNIGVVMALGDSITAGFLATPPTESDWLGDQRVLGGLVDLEEYRGVSYAIGGDRGSVTIPRILQRYTKPHGQSHGNHPPLACPHASCQHLPDDALNAAVSGAVSLNLPQQANDYLVPTYRNMSGADKQAWALLNVAVGANDILTAANSPFGPGTPEEYARGIREAVDSLIVNIGMQLPTCLHRPRANAQSAY